MLFVKSFLGFFGNLKFIHHILTYRKKLRFVRNSEGNSSTISKDIPQGTVLRQLFTSSTNHKRFKKK